jgi:hypothetical protein
MPETRSVKKVFLGKPDGRRRRGRPRKRWLDDLEKDLRKLGEGRLRTERNGGMWSRRPRPYMGCSADQKKKNPFVQDI